MATSIQLKSGSLFCGNPIMVSVGAEAPGSKATFHRVKLEVSVALYGISTDYHLYTLSAPATDAEIVQIDISSTLRSVAELFEYTYLTADKTYPHLTYTLKAYDEYMINGILYERMGERNYGSTLSALMGSFSDMERYISGSTRSVQKFSRKPNTGEICATSETLLYPTPFPTPATLQGGVTSGPTVKAYPLAGLSGSVTKNGHTVYVIPDDDTRFAFQFVNSLGVIESISASCLSETSTEKTIEQFTVTAPGSFNKFRRNIVRKLTDRRTLNMSSGPVDDGWADWWTHEFLNAEHAWMFVEGHWIPCSILPDEETKGINKSSNDFPEVFFSISPGFSGSIKSYI